MFGVCLDHVWSVFGSCLDHSRTFLGNERSRKRNPFNIKELPPLLLQSSYLNQFLYNNNKTQQQQINNNKTQQQQINMLSIVPVIFFSAVAGMFSLHAVHANPMNPSSCRQIDLSKHYTHAGAKIHQIAQYYNVTTPDVSATNGTNETTTSVYFSMSGSATILDACTFQLDNFTISSVAPDTVFYGKNASDYNVGQMVSWGSIQSLNGTNGTTVSFSLIEGVTFETIDTIIFYSRPSGLQLAYFTFPRKVVGLNDLNNTDINGQDQSSGAMHSLSSSGQMIAIVISMLVGILML